MPEGASSNKRTPATGFAGTRFLPTYNRRLGRSSASGSEHFWWWNRHRAVCFTLAILICGTQGSFAQTPVTSATAGSSQVPQEASAQTADGESSKKEELTIEALITKALTAYGGKDALLQLDASQICFGKQINSQEGENSEHAVRIARKGSRWRIDFDAPEESAAPHSDGTTPPDQSAPKPTSGKVTAFDGQSGWQAVGSEVVDLSDVDLQKKLLEFDQQPTLLTCWQEPGYTFKLVGKTTYNQIPVYAVEVTRGGNTTTLFIDRSNYLVVGLSYSVPQDPSKTVTVEYSEYRPTGGTMLPYRHVQKLNEQVVNELHFSNITLTTSIDDAMFTRPVQGKTVRLSKAITIPFDYAQKEILLKVRLNNSEELDFMFDTGASDTIIDRRVAADSFLLKQGQFGIAALGGVVTAQSTVVKRIEIGNNLILNDMEARIVDLSAQSRNLNRRIAGIIGTNIISKFLVTIDYSKPEITFADSETAPRPKGAAQAAFLQRGAPVVKANLNGRDEVKMLVDTGAAFNNLPSTVAARHVKGDAPTKYTTEATGLDLRPVKLGKVSIDALALGGLTSTKVPFTYIVDAKKPANSQLKPGEATRNNGGFFENSNLGILGNPFLQDYIVTIDYKFQRMLLQPNPVLKIRSEIDQAISSGDTKLIIQMDFRQAEIAYQRALMVAMRSGDHRNEARALGRLGNLRRIMSKDLNRPEHSKAAYDYFVKAQNLARKYQAPDVEGRVLADWSLLYADSGQPIEAKQMVDRAILLAPQDATVNVVCAVHLSKLKQFPDMQKCLEKALFIEPSNWQALWYQVKLSETFFDYPKVLNTLKEIRRYYPNSKTALDKINEIQTMLNAAAQASKIPQVQPGTIPTIITTPPSSRVPNASGGHTRAPSTTSTPATTPKTPAAQAPSTSPAPATTPIQRTPYGLPVRGPNKPNVRQ